MVEKYQVLDTMGILEIEYFMCRDLDSCHLASVERLCNTVFSISVLRIHIHSNGLLSLHFLSTHK
jgi:hypothetical protein